MSWQKLETGMCKALFQNGCEWNRDEQEIMNKGGG